MEYARPGVSVGASSALIQGARGTEPERISAVAREIQTANKIGAGLHDLLDRLEQRLISVRVPQPPSAAKNAEASPAAPTDLAQSLQTVNSTISGAFARLQTIVESIDL